ncbi:TetR/AcrR family transcriptional regulator [Desulfurella sp.]|uniref:TetR/AcrR family transcriptional regulator n=1 Tax=Desulfurella sp. TaxID=1962857 RepID=UPI003D0A5400
MKRLSSQKRQFVTIKTLLKLSENNNPDFITTSDIAKSMGLTQGAIFKHFPTKYDLFNNLINWISNHIMSILNKTLNNNDSALKALEDAFFSHIKFVSKYPSIPRILLLQLLDSRDTLPKRTAKKFLENYIEKLTLAVERGKINKEICESIDTQSISELFLENIQGLVLYSTITKNKKEILEKAKVVFYIFKKGISCQNNGGISE